MRAQSRVVVRACVGCCGGSAAAAVGRVFAGELAEVPGGGREPSACAGDGMGLHEEVGVHLVAELQRKVEESEVGGDVPATTVVLFPLQRRSLNCIFGHSIV